MTNTSHAPPLACADLASAIAALRARGLRLSASRRLVLEALYGADGPMSAEDLTRRLNLDPTSVYRNLEILESHGLVRHVHLGHGPGLYALLDKGEREYLFCESCGAVRAVSPDELDAVRRRIRDRFGYDVAFTHFAITGTCGSCAAPSPGPGALAATGDHPHAHRDERHRPRRARGGETAPQR
jgi:Fur family transcriptional regulator, ferric uptake regulator